MKLVTFQTKEALKDLITKGYLETNSNMINQKKNGKTYEWIVEKMNEIVVNEFDAKYPLWCWVKYKKGICPPKHKGEPIKGYDIKITFNKPKEEVFVTDFRRYSFLLNNTYIPTNKKDYQNYKQQLNKYKITAEDLKAYVRSDKYDSYRTDKEYLDICEKIRKSFDRVITDDSDILQGCVWRINLRDVEKIEVLNPDGYRYGSVNYIRSNGKRFNWIDDFIKKLS